MAVNGSRSEWDYRQALALLLPRGPAWERETAPQIHAVLAGLSPEFARLDARAHDLLAEMDPAGVTELVPDWERVMGLPDPCLGAAQTFSQRQQAVRDRLTAIGGQSRAYFEALALRLGFVVRIDESRPFRMGLSRFSERYGSKAFSYVWRVHELERDTPTIGGVGDVDQSRAAIACIFDRWKPAHTKVVFRFLDYLAAETVGIVLIVTEDDRMIAAGVEQA